MTITLESTYRKFARECSLLCSAFDSAVNTNCQSECRGNQFIREMSVIRLHDAWNRFCRELILSSASRKPITASGTRLSRAPGVNSYKDAVTVLLSTYTRRKTEPAWHNPNECLDAANRLKVPNYTAISNGLSLSFSGPAPTVQLTAIRNYLAHRNQGTSQGMVNVAQGLLISPVPRAFELVSEIVAPGTTLFFSVGYPAENNGAIVNSVMTAISHLTIRRNL